MQVVPLRRIPDERGTILHMLRSTDEHFIEFGEIYFSTIYADVVKGWHKHREMTLNYACIYGRIKLVLYDGREGSRTQGVVQELFLGPDNHSLVVIGPGDLDRLQGHEQPVRDRRQLLHASARPVADEPARPARQRHPLRLGGQRALSSAMKIVLGEHRRPRG